MRSDTMTSDAQIERRSPRRFRASLLKKQAEYRYYRLDYIVGVLIKLIFFVAMLLSLSSHDSRRLLVSVTAFILWYFSAHILGKLGNVFIEEAYLGTLPQILMTRASLTSFAIVAGLTEVVVSTIWVTLFLLLVVVARLVPVGEIAGILSAPTITGFTITAGLALVGVIGIGLTLFGLSVAWKRVGSFTEVLIFYMLFFSGFFLPLQRMPKVVMLSGYASPLYWAVQALANVVDGVSPRGEYIAMVLVAVGWNALGLVITGYFLRRAKAKGTLTHY